MWLDLKLENSTQGRNKNFSKEHPVSHCVCVCVCVGILYQRERKGEVQHELRTMRKDSSLSSYWEGRSKEYSEIPVFGEKFLVFALWNAKSPLYYPYYNFTRL